MRKINGFCVVLVVVFSLVVIFTGSVSAQTQPVVCPVGLLCTPTNQVVVVDCPVGYICVPSPVSIKPIVNASVATVGSTACYKFSSEMGYKGIYESVSMGTEVANLQNLLITKGFDIPSITKANTPAGSFDEDTRNAVMKYQSSKGIRATGYVGPLTMASLNALCLSDVPGSSRIKVLSPNGGEVLKEGGRFTIKWSSTNIPASSKIIIDIFNSSSADIKYPNNQIALLPSTATTYSWIVSGNNGWGIGKSSISQKVANLFGVKNANALNNQYVISVRAFDPVTYKEYAYDQSDSTFTIISGESPSPSPSGNSSSPMIYNISPSKGGLNTPIVLEGANLSAVTSLDLYASSGKWMGTLVPSSVTSNRITFSFSKAFTANTGSDTYQLSAVSSNCKAGCNSNRVSYTLDNSGSTPTPSPAQTPSQPRVSFTYPTGSETWYVGETKTVSWSYANFESNVSGDKWVDLMLQPMDGREPVKLATYTAPYTSTPLKIYTKTTDGRNAWLPGQYKLKLVCRTTNIEGFRSCAEAMPGYITIVQPTPSPTTGS